MKRSVDIMAAVVALFLTAPLLLIGIIGIKVTSPGPMLYRAKRVGKGGTLFEMLKLRSMHVTDGGPVITSRGDSRIFAWGRFLRASKIDELPQLFNVLRGDMSVVGPRPEDPAIVHAAYEPWMMETLDVRPGLTSPGSVYYYMNSEDLIDDADPEGSYIRDLLPMKLAVERVYIDRATVLSDIQVIFQTAWAVVAVATSLPGPAASADIPAARVYLAGSKLDSAQ